MHATCENALWKSAASNRHVLIGLCKLSHNFCEKISRIILRQIGSWSQCSSSCGADGFQSRRVQCVDSVGRKLMVQQCLVAGKNNELMEKPQSHKVCSTGPCPHWYNYHVERSYLITLFKYFRRTGVWSQWYGRDKELEN